jgi:hypothetical protein
VSKDFLKLRATFWRHILAPHFGATFWRHILAPHFGATFWRHFWAPFLGGYFLAHFLAPFLGTILKKVMFKFDERWVRLHFGHFLRPWSHLK